MCVPAVCLPQAAVGGRMRLFISGGAPLPPYAGHFMATAMNVPVLQVRRLEDLTAQLRAGVSAVAVTAVRYLKKRC
jgi:hypothetical protein